MPKKVKLFAAGVFLALVGVACVVLATTSAKADGSQYGDCEVEDGDGWSMSADGVFIVKNDQGWVDCLKNGFEVNVKKLIIGKDVTVFRMYEVSYEAPTTDFYDPSEIAGYDRFRKPYYEYAGASGLYPLKIEVEAGNPIFRVVDGLLINTETNELVLSEVGVTDVVIPEGVKTITREAFSERGVLTVQFPSTLTTIGEGAFLKCDKLDSADFPDSLTTLKAGSFSGCTSLQNVSLPAGLLVLDGYAFNECPIQHIEIPDTVEEVGSYAFLACDQLLQVSLPNGLKRIKTGSFGGCNQLQQINFPDQLKSIGEQAFCGCYGLKQVILPDSLQEIGNKAFWRCNLSVLRIPERLVFPIYSFKRNEFIVNPNSKSDKNFGLHSADTVIFSGSDYDFGYPAINNAKNVYFLGKPPEDVGQILDRDTTGNIYCSEEYEHEWTRSTIASWVRQKTQFLPADQLNDITQTAINTTPRPIVTPRTTPTPTPTLAPANTPQPVTSPTPELAAETNETTDPLLYVFAGILALVIAGIVVVAMNNKKTKKRSKKK